MLQLWATIFFLSVIIIEYAIGTHMLNSWFSTSGVSGLHTISSSRFTKRHDDEILSVLPVTPSATTSALHRACAKPKPRHKRQQRQHFGKVVDITEEMLPLHKVFTDAHQLPPFNASTTMRKVVFNWCELQLYTGCDLVYPLDRSFNVAKAPAFVTSANVIQRWYNERESYDSKKTILENLLLAQKGDYEVVHYINIAASYPERGLGCCRAPCGNGGDAVYACAYGPEVGGPYWTAVLGENDQGTRQDEEDTGQSQTIQASSLKAPGSGFTLVVSESFRNQLIASPMENRVRPIVRGELIQLGCSGNVPGSGPHLVLLPWIYPCAEKHSETTSTMTSTPSFDTQALWENENEILLHHTELVFLSECGAATAPSLPPFLLICPASCALPNLASQDDRLTVEYNWQRAGKSFVRDQGHGLCGRAAIGGVLRGEKQGGIVRVLSESGPLNAVYDLKSPYNKHGCGTTHFSFSSCKGAACSASFTTRSWAHPWITGIVNIGGGEDSGRWTMLLRDSLCVSGTLSVTMNLDFLPNKAEERTISLLSSYLNPDNLTFLEYSIVEGTVKLHRCFAGNCKVKNRVFVGDLSGGDLITLEMRVDCQGDTTAVIDQEVVGVLQVKESGASVRSKINMSAPAVIEPTIAIGFFGIAMNEPSDVNYLRDVWVRPSSCGKSTTQASHESKSNADSLTAEPFDSLLKSSLFPLWVVPGSKINALDLTSHV